MPENSSSEKKRKPQPSSDILGPHKSEGKSKEWVNMRNHKQSKERVATKREATKQKRKKTKAKVKSVRHQGLLALQTKQPKLGGTNL